MFWQNEVLCLLIDDLCYPWYIQTTPNILTLLLPIHIDSRFSPLAAETELNDTPDFTGSEKTGGKLFALYWETSSYMKAMRTKRCNPFPLE